MPGQGRITVPRASRLHRECRPHGGTGMRFFFDTDDGERRVADGSGIDLSGEAEAVEQAVALLRDLSHAGVGVGASRVFSVTVRDAAGGNAYAASLQLTVDRAA